MLSTEIWLILEKANNFLPAFFFWPTAVPPSIFDSSIYPIQQGLIKKITAPTIDKIINNGLSSWTLYYSLSVYDSNSISYVTELEAKTTRPEIAFAFFTFFLPHYFFAELNNKNLTGVSSFRYQTFLKKTYLFVIFKKIPNLPRDSSNPRM